MTSLLHYERPKLIDLLVVSLLSCDLYIELWKSSIFPGQFYLNPVDK